MQKGIHDAQAPVAKLSRFAAHACLLATSLHMHAAHVLTTQLESHAAVCGSYTVQGSRPPVSPEYLQFPYCNQIHRIFPYTFCAHITINSTSVWLPSSRISIIPRCWSQHCSHSTQGRIMSHGDCVRAWNYCVDYPRDGVLLPRTQGPCSLKAKTCLSAIQLDLL